MGAEIMNNRPLRNAVTRELAAASDEHNPAAELEELRHHLELQLERVNGAIAGAYLALADDPVYPEDDYALTTLPPTSDDDDEQDAEADDSDHIYDPYAFADGH